MNISLPPKGKASQADVFILPTKALFLGSPLSSRLDIETSTLELQQLLHSREEPKLHSKDDGSERQGRLVSR